MSRIRAAQDVVEVLQAENDYARVTQDVVEVIQAFTLPTPVVGTNVTSGTAATVSSQATASHNPTANTLYILTVVAKDAAAANTTPTATHAGGLFWTLVAHAVSGSFATTVFRAMKPSGLSAGVTTILFGGSSQTVVGWSIDQYTNTDISGTDGSGALVQSVVGSAASGTSLSISLATPASPWNTAAGSFGHNVNEAVTVGTGFTAVGSGTSTLLGYKTEYEVGVGVTTVNATWTTTAVNAGVAYEIRCAGGLGGPAPPASFGVVTSQHVLEVLAVNVDSACQVSQHVIEVLVVENLDRNPTQSYGYSVNPG